MAKEELDEAAVLDEAITCNQQGAHTRAIALCNQLIEVAVDDPWAQPFSFRGSSRLALGDAAGALADLIGSLLRTRGELLLEYAADEDLWWEIA